MEMWRTIYEFPKYDISSSGRCMNAWTGKILTPQIQAETYIVYLLFHNGLRYERQAARLVATAFIRDPRPGEIVRHKDGDISNNYLENLEWVTRRDQALDYKRKGDYQYILVEEMGAVFKSYRELGRYFGVAPTTVRHAALRNKKLKGYTISLIA